MFKQYSLMPKISKIKKTIENLNFFHNFKS